MRLTEEMVIARSKQSDLNSIRRLNLWGSELSDISIIQKMGSIEVLALSVNNISSLQPFEHCYKLQELYLRRNKVADFKELLYLQKLPKLKHLWLDENPCSLIPGVNYRAKVLSILPNLVKLDDKAVTQDDLEMAERLSGDSRADDYSPPASPDISSQQHEMLYEQPSPPPTRPQRELQRTPPQTPTSRQPQNYMPQRQQQQHQQYKQQSPQREHDTTIGIENGGETSLETINSNTNLNANTELSPTLSSQPSQEPLSLTSPKVENNCTKETQISNSQADVLRSPGSDLESSMIPEFSERAPPMHPSCSTQSMKEYYQSDRPVHPPTNYRHSQIDLTEWEEQQPQHHQHPHPQQHQQQPQPQHTNHYNQQQQQHQQQQQQYQPNDIYASTQTINYASHNSIGGGSAQRNGIVSRENGDEWDDGRSARVRRSEGRFYDSSNTGSTPALHHHAGYHRRPASRSANLLSATLCLIKELDYSSLEVIEHAVRCRIDELSSD